MLTVIRVSGQQECGRQTGIFAKCVYPNRVAELGAAFYDDVIGIRVFNKNLCSPTTASLSTTLVLASNTADGVEQGH